MAKKDPELRMKYYESVREHTLAMIHKAEEAVQQLKALGDDFSDVFEKSSKRHSSLLNKVVKLVERDRSKFEDSAKAALKKVKMVKKAKEVKKAKPLTPQAETARRQKATFPEPARDSSVG